MAIVRKSGARQTTRTNHPGSTVPASSSSGEKESGPKGRNGKRTKVPPVQSEKRTIDILRGAGFIAGNVQKFNHYTKRFHDLFGFIDIVAIPTDSTGTLFIQSTGGAGKGMERVHKVLNDPDNLNRASAILVAGNRIEVWEWNRYKPRGVNRYYFDAKRWVLVLEFGRVVYREVETANEYANHLDEMQDWEDQGRQRA